MKKILSFLATISLSTGPALGLQSVVSCTHTSNDANNTSDNGSSVSNTEIKLSKKSLDLTISDEQTIKILNIDKLENVEVSSNDPSICKVSIASDTIYIDSLKEGTTQLIVNASNADKSVSVELNNASVLENALPNIKNILNLANTLLGNISDESSIATTLSGVIPLAGQFSSIISPILQSLNNIDPEYFSLIGDAINPSAYGTMTFSQVMQASQIRLINGITSLVNNDGSSDENIVDWKDSSNLSSNLSKSLSNLSGVVTDLLDNKISQSLSDDNDVINKIYSSSEIIGAIVPILDYISKFDITSGALTYNDISNVLSQTYNDGDDVEINLSRLANNLDKAADSEQNLQNLIGILFAESSSTGGKDDLLLSLSENSLTYSKSGLMPIFQAFLYGTLQSDSVEEKINEAIGSTLKSLSKPLANALPKLATFMFNGWDENNIYVNAYITVKLSDADSLISMFTSDENTIATIKSVLTNPMDLIASTLIGIIPGLKEKYLNQSTNSILEQLSISFDLNRYIGKLGDSYISDLLELVKSSMCDDSYLSLTGLGSLIGGLGNSTDDSEYSTVLQYIANNGDQIGDINSNFWKYLGLESTTKLSDNSLLKGLSLIITKNWSSTYNFLSNLLDGIDNIYKS